MPNVAIRLSKTTKRSESEPPARLTSFRPLQTAASQADASKHPEVTGQTDGGGRQASQQQTAVGQNGLQKTTPQTQQQLSSDQPNLPLPPPSITVDETIRQRAPFSIVWTELTFEVGLTNYEKLINTTLDGARSLCSLGGLLSCRDKKVIDFSASQMEASKSVTDGGTSKPIEPSDAVTSKMVDLGFDRRVVFENLNGYINSGELSAILGPSGAGKTSLLNALCGKTENYRGRIQLIGGGRQRMRLSIIPQKDYLIENLTVRENLLYSSRLLNPARDFNHEANIMRVVRMLNLTACFRSTVANISGGEYKRVSIAQELLRQPDILVLDEPTSGLDSLNCKNLIGSLVKLIQASRDGLMKPIAIVMTIHQPDVEVFHMFDHVYCMARGGRVIYDGHPRDAVRLIREQANLVADQRLSSQLANGSRGLSNDRALQSPVAHTTTNPANLLIEIASEDLYGREPIERLARYQLKQFEQLQESLVAAAAATTDATANNGSSRSGRKFKSQPSQLQANLLTGHQDRAHKFAPRQEQRASDLSSPMISAASHGHQHLRQPSLSTSRSSSQSTLAGDKNGRAGTALSRDKRLNAKYDHSGLFLYHTSVLAQRAFVSTLRDPLMTIIALTFHLFIPFVMWTVYPKKIGFTHGCPINQRELDIVSMASERTAYKLEGLQEQVTTTLECSTMFFLTTYSFSMCSLSVAALAFPLNMHILLKEVRNGWYNLPAYVLAKTIANFPFEVLFPVISLVMIYVMLGMPSSDYEWRLWAIAIVMALVSMISHTQGLIFGALCMDSVQTAIFLASASSLPQTLLSGFTARIKHMPWLLQKLSWFSQYRYSSDLINMIRFGFDICPCNSATDEYIRTRQPEFRDIPNHLKPVFVYYLLNNTPEPNATTDNNSNSTDPPTTTIVNGTQVVTTPPPTATTATNATARIPGVDYELTLSDAERYELLKRMEANELDLFARMADTISRSFSYGRKLEGCPSVRSQLLVTGGTPSDEFLPILFGCMFCLLILSKVLLFIVVRYKIGSRI
jgi:ABC-type multidrug transport system ATPase subunit